MPFRTFKQTLRDVFFHCGQASHLLNPKMQPFLQGFRKGQAIFDLNQCVYALLTAWYLIRGVYQKGGHVIFVTESPFFGDIIAPLFKHRDKVTLISSLPLPGFLSNWKRLFSYSAAVHEQETANPSPGYDWETYRKKFGPFSQLFEGQQSPGGQPNYENPGLPDLIVFFHPKASLSLLKEAHSLQIPTIGLANSDEDPSLLTVTIPGNNKHPQAIAVCALFLASALDPSPHGANMGMAAGGGNKQQMSQ